MKYGTRQKKQYVIFHFSTSYPNM